MRAFFVLSALGAASGQSQCSANAPSIYSGSVTGIGGNKINRAFLPPRAPREPLLARASTLQHATPPPTAVTSFAGNVSLVLNVASF